MFAASTAWSQASERLFTALARYEKKGFTGCVEIRVGADCLWRCSFSGGRLGWVDGGVHPWRSWHRQLAMLGDPALRSRVDHLENQQEVVALAQKALWVIPLKLLGTGKLAPQQFVSLLNRRCRESLFDIVWEIERCVQAGERRGSLQLTDLNNERPLGQMPASWMVGPQQLCARVRQDWLDWKAALPSSAVDCHVDRAPIVVEPELLALSTGQNP